MEEGGEGVAGHENLIDVHHRGVFDAVGAEMKRLSYLVINPFMASGTIVYQNFLGLSNIVSPSGTLEI